MVYRLVSNFCFLFNFQTTNYILLGKKNKRLSVHPSLISGYPDWHNNITTVISTQYSKLRNIRGAVKERYNNEFLQTLIQQAKNMKGRFKPVPHKVVNVCDVVLIKEENCKSIEYPLAIVESITKNYLDEITDV